MKSHLRLAGMIFNQPQLVTDQLMELAVQWANQSLNLNIVNLTVQAAQPMLMEDDGPDPGAQMARAEERRRAVIAETGVDIIPVSGILVSRSAHVNPCETMTSYESLRTAVQSAAEDPTVEHIVLDIDTNGGSATGAFELGDDIRAAAQVKPISAIVNYSAFSGGYLIAAAASEVIVSRTSGVGSIGVIAKHLDVSQRDAQQGVKVTSVFAGNHKNDLSPHEPISEQSLQFLTDMVQNNYAQFVDAVARYRGLSVQAVRDTEAGLFFGQKAVDAGLADRVEAPQAAVNRIAAEVRAARAERSGTRRSVAVRAASMNMQAAL